MSVGTILFRALPYLLIALLFFLPPIDTDLGWHLRYGNYLLETGEVLRENTLTYFLSDHVWQHSYTLYQLVTSLIYKWAGLIGLSCACAGLMAVLFVIFQRISPKLPQINFLAFLGVSWMGWGVFHLGWRSQIFTVVGVALMISLLSKLKEKPRLMLVFPPLFILWANLHGSFVLGLALLGFGVVQEAVKQDWRSALHLVGASAASAAAALLNPFGVGIYREAWRHAYYPLGNLIAEWVPPSILWMEVIIVVALAALIALLDSKSRRKVFWLLSLGLSTWLALSARRNLPLFAVVASFAFGELLAFSLCSNVVSLTLIDTLGDRLCNLENHPVFTAIFRVGICVSLLGLLFFHLPSTLEVDTNPVRYCEAGTVAYPCEAIAYIRSYPPKGKNAYAAYEWGGFLEWQLPQYRYFVDGRMPTWPAFVLPEADYGEAGPTSAEDKSPYTVYLEIIQAQAGYQERLDSYGTDWLLIGAGTFLDLELQGGESVIWQEVYRDELAAIYLKRNANP